MAQPSINSPTIIPTSQQQQSNPPLTEPRRNPRIIRPAASHPILGSYAKAAARIKGRIRQRQSRAVGSSAIKRQMHALSAESARSAKTAVCSLIIQQIRRLRPNPVSGKFASYPHQTEAAGT
jgi:hypothetical protein